VSTENIPVSVGDITDWPSHGPLAVTRPTGRHTAHRPSHGPQGVTQSTGRHTAHWPSRGPQGVTRPTGRHTAHRASHSPQAVTRPTGRHTVHRPSHGPHTHYYTIYTDMRRLTTGIRSEKCAVRQFCCCVNVTDCLMFLDPYIFVF
jgi:hypothetical protein